MSKKLAAVLAVVVLFSVILSACGGAASTPAPVAGSDTAGTTPAAGDAPKAASLILGAYTTPREAYGKLIPIFKEQWKAKTGQELTFEESYLGSGAQSRAIVEGFEADVAALSLEADVNRIEKAGLITQDWRDTPGKGMVSDSVVVFAVRKGNPLGITDWADLAKPGIQILTPNPKTSGGAMWNLLALYGAAKRGFVEGVPAGDDEAAKQFLISVLKNVTVMDKGARESITNFEKGVGDVAITYENEVLVAKRQGLDYDMVIPRSTILIENPIAVVDGYADKHGTRQAAQAFVDFLMTKEAQEVFAQYGLRSIDPEVLKATAAQYPAIADLFTIQEFGGWNEATPKYFGDDGIVNQAIIQAQDKSQ